MGKGLRKDSLSIHKCRRDRLNSQAHSPDSLAKVNPDYRKVYRELR